MGVVYRGRFWLDGILTCALGRDKRDDNSRISRAIKESKQYSQLHAVILSSNRILRDRKIDITDLSHKLRLPVIALELNSQPRSGKKPGKTVGYRIVVNGRRISVLASGNSSEIIQEMFGVACRRDHAVPEAVRVADLITRQRLRLLEN